MRKREDRNETVTKQAENAVAESTVTLVGHAAAERLPRAALERFADFSPGDSLSITLGEEKYSPVSFRNFTIGPFSATVVVRPDETGADAAMRCYRVLLELNEAEFQIAWRRHKERLNKTDGER